MAYHPHPRMAPKSFIAPAYYSHLEPTTLTGPGLAIRAAALTAVVAVVVVVAFVVGVPGVVIAGVELVVMKVFENLCKWGACRSAST